ncbi:hypothetical protein F5X99DRAFT_420320 [Biscogniauxia marginata]|nr:hypothetical protein F5X99DRAFT_420320 [Biscogniauxia marginata]
MRNEAKKSRNRPRQLDMPFLSSPTKTVQSYGAGSGKEPAITSATELGTTQFVLGIDTRFLLRVEAVFISNQHLVTCDFGYECTNIGTYRGCCVPGASDCTSTIYTSCIDYGQVPNSAQCGPHSLCCPSTAGSCFSYGFITDDEPGATFTHVQCQESRGFGEMYPYPPELSTSTDASAVSSLDSSSTLSVEPSNDDGHSSNSAPAGAIAGAVIGAIAFICLFIVAVYLFMRRRRQRQQRRQIGAAMISTEPTNLKDEPPGAAAAETTALGVGSLRPLSTIHEQRSPAISPSREKRKSAPTGRQSFKPDWPLGLNGNPLASHPVDLEKRLSLDTLGADRPAALAPPPQQARQEPQQPHVPILKVPTPPPPPGTRLAPPPPPPPPKSPRHSSSVNPRTPTSVGASLQSPRVSYVPVSPIEAAFGDEMDRRRTWLEDNAESRFTGTAAAASNTRKSHGSGITPPVLSLQGLNNISSTDFARDNRTDRDPDPVSPVSPLDDDDDDNDGDDDDTKRLSFVSVPSAPGEGDREADDLVSPISPNDRSNLDGRVSPATVSPLESRQGSIVGR